MTPPSAPNRPTYEFDFLEMKRLAMVWSLPSKTALKEPNVMKVDVPMGTQPAPSFQYVSPASAVLLPLVSKSRSATNSYPEQPVNGQPK